MMYVSVNWKNMEYLLKLRLFIQVDPMSTLQTYNLHPQEHKANDHTK